MNQFLLFAVTVLIWGSTWLMIEFQLGVVEPTVSVAWRYWIAAALVFAWCGLRGLRLRYGFEAHVKFIGLGALLFSLNYISNYVAQIYISSALNAVVFTAMMWLNVLFARLFLGTRIEPRTWAGAALGSIGIATLFWPALAGADGGATHIGVAFGLAGATFASLGNILSKHIQNRGLPILPTMAWGTLYGAGFTTLIAWRLGHPFIVEPTIGYVGSLLFLAILGTVVAFACYLRLIGSIGPHRAGYVVVMFPLVAIVLSLLFEGLDPAPHMWLGMALILAGNVAVLGGWKGSAAMRERWREWVRRKRVVSDRCTSSVERHKVRIG